MACQTGQRGGVERGRDQGGLVLRQRGIKEGQTVFGVDRGQPGPSETGPIGRIEVSGHRAGGLPVAPGQAGGREVVAVTLGSQRVQGGVGGRVVGLTGGAQDCCGRGKHHKRGQLGVAAQPVQMPGRVGLGRQHGVKLWVGQLGEHGVLEDPGGVDDRPQPVSGRDSGQHRGQLGGVGGVTGGDADISTQPGEPFSQINSPRGGRAATRDQQQPAHTVAGE